MGKGASGKILSITTVNCGIKGLDKVPRENIIGSVGCRTGGNVIGSPITQNSISFRERGSVFRYGGPGEGEGRNSTKGDRFLTTWGRSVVRSQGNISQNDLQTGEGMGRGLNPQLYWGRVKKKKDVKHSAKKHEL